MQRRKKSTNRVAKSRHIKFGPSRDIKTHVTWNRLFVLPMMYVHMFHVIMHVICTWHTLQENVVETPFFQTPFKKLFLHKKFYIISQWNNPPSEIPLASIRNIKSMVMNNPPPILQSQFHIPSLAPSPTSLNPWPITTSTCALIWWNFPYYVLLIDLPHLMELHHWSHVKIALLSTTVSIVILWLSKSLTSSSI